jgi:hypothetical protein
MRSSQVRLLLERMGDCFSWSVFHVIRFNYVVQVYNRSFRLKASLETNYFGRANL